MPPKSGSSRSRATTRSASSVSVKIIAAVLFVALMGAGLARADDALPPPGFERRAVPIACDEAMEKCEIAFADLLVLQKSAHESAVAIGRLTEELARNRRNCPPPSKLEVLPKIKPDRNS
jgi:hypothetical protein